MDLLNCSREGSGQARGKVVDRDRRRCAVSDSSRVHVSVAFVCCAGAKANSRRRAKRNFLHKPSFAASSETSCRVEICHVRVIMDPSISRPFSFELFAAAILPTPSSGTYQWI